MKCLIAAALVAGIATPAFSQVPVFVTSSGMVEGMGDPNEASQKTVEDFRKIITKRKKGLVVADQRTDLCLLVLPTEGKQVTVKLLFKGHESELGYHLWGHIGIARGTSYRRRYAAEQIVKQLEKWVAANKEKF